MASKTQPRKMRRRGLSEPERLLWHHAIRDTEPLYGRKPLEFPNQSPSPVPITKPPPIIETLQTAARPSPAPIYMPRVGTRAPSLDGLDHQTAKRLARGQITIDGRLDLHGMTQNQARDALDSFIARAWDGGKRAVLIITGKGARTEDTGLPWRSDREQATKGVLRASVPRWLNEPPNRSRIFAITEAQPRHGGTGALYVLIRRRRD